MFIDIDDEHVIQAQKVLTVLDINLLDTSSKLKEFIDKKIEAELVVGQETDSKSLIITDEYVYFSPYSTVTLTKRFNMSQIINNLESYSNY